MSDSYLLIFYFVCLSWSTYGIKEAKNGTLLVVNAFRGEMKNIGEIKAKRYETLEVEWSSRYWNDGHG